MCRTKLVLLNTCEGNEQKRKTSVLAHEFQNALICV